MSARTPTKAMPSSPKYRFGSESADSRDDDFHYRGTMKHTTDSGRELNYELQFRKESMARSRGGSTKSSSHMLKFNVGLPITPDLFTTLLPHLPEMLESFLALEASVQTVLKPESKKRRRNDTAVTGILHDYQLNRLRLTRAFQDRNLVGTGCVSDRLFSTIYLGKHMSTWLSGMRSTNRFKGGVLPWITYSAQLTHDATPLHAALEALKEGYITNAERTYQLRGGFKVGLNCGLDRSGVGMASSMPCVKKYNCLWVTPFILPDANIWKDHINLELKFDLHDISSMPSHTRRLFHNGAFPAKTVTINFHLTRSHAAGAASDASSLFEAMAKIVSDSTSDWRELLAVAPFHDYSKKAPASSDRFIPPAARSQSARLYKERYEPGYKAYAPSVVEDEEGDVEKPGVGR